MQHRDSLPSTSRGAQRGAAATPPALSFLAMTSVALGWLLAAPAAAPAAALAAAPGAEPGARVDAQEQAPAKLQPWLKDLDAARESSAARNAPLLILAILEGEETSDRVRDEIYHGKEFLAASAGTIVVVVNNGTHKTKTIKVTTKDGIEVERKICSLYETPSCADHQRSMDRVYQEYHENGDFKMPHLIAILPDGKIHDRSKDEIQIADAVRIAEAAKEAAGPSLSTEELLEVRGKLDAMHGFQKARLWVEAWRAGTRVLEITQAARYADPARGGVEKALAGMRGDLEAAHEVLTDGDVEGGYVRLLKLRDELAATPLEKEAKDLVRKIERDKRYKDAIKNVQRRAEAEELWTKVIEALDADKESTAKRHAQRLLDRYADTPAAERARKRFPELVPAD